jgi:diguanylate cyclase
LLVVDDERDILGLLAAQLSQDFDVILATSAEEARAVFSQRDVDIILSDQYLDTGRANRESGTQLLEWVRLQRSATVRILMTGQASLQDALDAINRGQVHRFLLKPFNGVALRETLAEAARSVVLERSNEQLLAEMRQLNQDLELRVQQRTRELEEANRQLKYKNSILEKMALTDPLTGLPNRRAMDRLVRTEIQRRSRTPAPLSLLIIDADNFKDINTRFLLPGGDHTLIWLAQVLARTVRSVDAVGRIGGEEFLVLAPSTEYEGACILAERLRLAVAGGRTIYNDQGITMTVSIGAGIVDQDSPVSYEQLKDLAASSLAEAKQQGRNRSVSRIFPVSAEYLLTRGASEDA